MAKATKKSDLISWSFRWIIGAHGLYENKNKKGTHQHAQLPPFHKSQVD
jgi:hypothetical protein